MLSIPPILSQQYCVGVCAGVAEGLYQPGVQDFDGSKIELKEAKQFFASETEGPYQF